MALKMNANAKTENNNRQRTRCLDDPERVRKDLEQERRITRLQQVREKSNTLARKIREDVAAEKARQADKYEEIKQKELNAWREHVVAKKHHDYRTAVFQVGAAHRAALAEIEKTEQQKQLRAKKMQKCRRLASKSQLTKKSVTNVVRMQGEKGQNVEGRVTAGTQTPVQQSKDSGKENRLCNKNCRRKYDSAKRKRRPCFQDDDHFSEVDLDLPDDTLTGNSSCDENTPTSETGKLRKTPPVILDIDRESEDSLDICSHNGIEINDRHMETNRQFSRIVQASPRPESQPRAGPSRKRFTRIADLVQQLEPDSNAPVSSMRGSDAVTRSCSSPSRGIAAALGSSSPRRKTNTTANASSPERSRKEEAVTDFPKQSTRSTTQQGQSQKLSLRFINKSSIADKVIDASIKRSATMSPSNVSNKVIDAGIKRSSATSTVSDKLIDAGIKRGSTMPAEPTRSGLQGKGKSQLLQELPKEQPRQKQRPEQGPHLPTVFEDPPLQQAPVRMQQQPIQQPRQPQIPMQQVPLQTPMHHPTVQQMPMAPLHPFPLPYEPSILPTFSMLPYHFLYPPQGFPLPPSQGFPTASPPPPPAPPFPAAPQPMRPSTNLCSNQPLCTTVTTSTSCVSQKLSVAGGDKCTSTAKSVQYYDHNNKYQRNYKPHPQAVQVNVPDETHLNAMDHARIESQLNQLRELELEKLRKVNEDRGQKALQREQVRRDCVELTEKLDALAQKNPQLLPSDANFVPSYRFVDLANRHEQKMNEAMEQMLLRPAIVTCPEVGRHFPKKTNTYSKSQATHTINVGEPPTENPNDAGSAGSCCSLLIDYVDDQTKQLRCELRGMQSNSAKSVKLRDLLKRIEKIRAQLIAELKAGEVNETNAQKVIESICRERSVIHTLDDREVELQRKEALLDERVKQFYKQQNGKKQEDNPVEIIIKVKSDGTVKQVVPKPQSYKNSCKAKLKENTSTQTGFTSETAETRSTDLGANADNRNIQSQRQNSIDSTSTQYRELPPVNYENVKAASASPCANTAEPLHPTIAKYVERLLCMSKNSIEKLGINCSDRPTPASSIINQSSNVFAEDTESGCVERAQALLQDNRSFVNELEDTIRGQQQQNEVRELDDNTSWNTLFASNKKLQVKRTRTNSDRDTRNKDIRTVEEPRKEKEPRADKNVNKAKEAAILLEKPPNHRKDKDSRIEENNRHFERPTTSSYRNPEILAKDKSRKQPSKLSSKLVPTQVTSPLHDSIPCRSSHVRKSPASSQESSSSQMERYAKLTENCTQRIAELTELITKVREEKQRLVEVTLTSASEGDRHSTEYFDLPPLQKPDKSNNPGTDSHNTTTQSNSEAMPPLQKHKSTGASLDSGISGSRPMTAMGGVLELPAYIEPTTLDAASAAQRRTKMPPATIRRYSPQLAEELPHELSTITEVDTPGQSHIAAPIPVAFPSFEQYARELQLNLSTLDVDQSLRLKHEFHELIQVIKQRGANADYREFPSIHAYLHDVTATTTATHVQIEEDHRDQTTRQSMPTEEVMKWRLSNVTINEFPDRREYMEQLMESVPPEHRDMIDSASLESSDSLDVEAELRRRHLLTHSFRRTASGPDNDVASSTRRESMQPDTIIIAPNESAIQPFPAMQSSSKRQQQRQSKSRNKSVSSSSPEPQTKREEVQRSTGGGLSPPQDVSQMGRALNLREFLTRELLKHRVRHGGSSSDSADDSLKSNFLQSVIDSLSRTSTPRSPGLGHGNSGTNDRQKTSTPVGSFLTGQDRSVSLPSSETQLFSGESRISAVNYADGTPPVPFDQQRLSPPADYRGPSIRAKSPNRRNASRK